MLLLQSKKTLICLGFGNCVKSSVVNVYLNGQLIGSAGPNQNSHVKYMYKGGDILRITEENFGIIKINSLQLSCQGKWNKFLRHQEFN